jgi:hypothetical protein
MFAHHLLILLKKSCSYYSFWHWEIGKIDLLCWLLVGLQKIKKINKIWLDKKYPIRVRLGLGDFFENN